MGNFHLFGPSSSIPLWSYKIADLVIGVSISSNGTGIAMGGAYPDNSVYYFQKNSSQPIWSYLAGDVIRCVKISSDGKYIVAGTAANDAKIYLFDTINANPLWNYSIIESGSYINSVAMSSDGTYIATQIYHDYDFGEIILFKNSSSVPFWSYQVESADNNGYEAIALSKDGKYIATTTRYNVYLFDRDKSSPQPFELTTDAEIPDSDGKFYLNWTDSQNADNYSIYRASSPISINKHNVYIVGTGITNLSYYVEGIPSGEYYFAVEAYNEIGKQLSKNIFIWVHTTSTVAGYEIFIIIASLSLLTIATLRTTRKRLKISPL